LSITAPQEGCTLGDSGDLIAPPIRSKHLLRAHLRVVGELAQLRVGGHGGQRIDLLGLGSAAAGLEQASA
jgi:hypothetical protein